MRLTKTFMDNKFGSTLLTIVAEVSLEAINTAIQASSIQRIALAVPAAVWVANLRAVLSIRVVTAYCSVEARGGRRGKDNTVVNKKPSFCLFL